MMKCAKCGTKYKKANIRRRSPSKKPEPKMIMAKALCAKCRIGTQWWNDGSIEYFQIAPDGSYEWVGSNRV